jgi:hypothetical protein
MSRIEIPFSTKLTVRLGEAAYETDDHNLILIVMECDATKVEFNYLLHLKEAIRRQLEKEGKQYVKKFNEQEHYKKPSEFLADLVKEYERKRMKRRVGRGEEEQVVVETQADEEKPEVEVAEDVEEETKEEEKA